MLRPLLVRKLRRYVAAIPALAFGFVASPAFSTVVTINASGVTAGSTTANFTGATMTSTGGTFTKATSPGVNPTQYIGVSGGAVANEVDGSQRITLSFGAGGAVINELVIGMLFPHSVAGDLFNEAAQAVTVGGSCTSAGLGACILSATGATTAVWRGSPFGVENLVPATGGNGGIFKITDPFGSDLLSSASFLAYLIAGSGDSNSDWGLVSITYTTAAVIPEPGTLMLVSLGMLGLGFAGRRRARS
jgi:hypothetical protein